MPQVMALSTGTFNELPVPVEYLSMILSILKRNRNHDSGEG